MAQIATLEGLGRARSCVAVRAGKDGRCVCARHGPPGSGHPFKDMCRGQGLPVIVGSTHLDSVGTHLGGSKMAKHTSIDYPPLNDFSIGQLLPTPEQFRESLMVAGGAAGSILAGAFVLPKLWSMIGADTWHPLLRAGLVLGLAVIGGGLLFQFSPQLAVGVIGGLGGLAVATAIGGLADMPVSLGYFGQDDDASFLPEERNLLGSHLSDVTVQPQQGNEVFGDVTVMPRAPNEAPFSGALAAVF